MDDLGRDSETSSTELLKEVRRLREKLDQAEATLQGIADGTVDAVVLPGGTDAPRPVFEGTFTYKTFVEQMGDAAVTVDADGIITYCNRSFEEMVGLPQSEAIGNTFVSCLDRESDRRLQFDVGEEPQRHYDIDIIDADGKAIPVDLSMTALSYGDVKLFCVTIHDLRPVKAQQRKFEMLFEHMTESVFIVDLHGTIVEMNGIAAERLGYTETELHGRPVESILGAGAPSIERLSRELEINQSRTVEAEQVRRDGTVLKSEMNFSRTQLDTTPVIMIVARDVTVRKELEERLQQSQRLEAIGQLAGGVAHDFNNLLMVIQGFAEVLVRRRTEDDPERRFLDEIINATSRAADLADQLLAFGRKQDVSVVSLDLHEVVRDSEKMLKRMLPENIVLSTELSEDSCYVKADANQIGQILLNLAANARDAMRDGGSIVIRAACVSLTTEFTGSHSITEPGEYVRLTVADTGTGMDEDTRDRIFEPFFTTKGIGEGTGLGLSTVYGFVKQAGGYIFCESEPGEGTSFDIYFPKTSPEATDTEDLPGSHEAPSSDVILLVEDEEMVRDVIRQILETENITVIEARSGTEARAILEERVDIGLVITDMVMPDGGGVELARYLNERKRDIKLILMTGYSRTGTETLGDLDLSWELLKKPVQPQRLINTIARMQSSGTSKPAPAAGGASPEASSTADSESTRKDWKP